jgi:NAD(P)-dependent dehydrogenase (short-subunit alcohol dehydrogenase family)
MAALFAREGARVIASDIDRVRAEELAEKIRSSGGDAVAAWGDISRSRQAFGDPDILVNNAFANANDLALADRITPSKSVSRDRSCARERRCKRSNETAAGQSSRCRA